MSAHIAEIISAARIPPLAEAAIALGLPVFPCTPNKAPLVSQGFKAATTDRAQIIAAFSQPGAALIGVPTGAASGLTVVDVDIKGDAPGMAWLQDNEHALPPTRTHATRSGGWHLVFRHVPGIRNSAGRIAPGVDVRGEGGYVIFPPSPGYTVADAADPADMPEWLVNACLPAPAPRPAEYHRTRDVIPDRYAEAALEGECRAVASAREGTRNHALNVSAVKLGSIVAAGALSRGTVEAELLAAARSAGLPTFEAERTIRSGLEFGVRQPRQVRERAEEREVEVHPAAAFLAKINGQAARKEAKPLPVTPELMDVDGALKMLVDDCLRTAIRPQPFLALGAAICAVGALAGRQYRTHTDLRTNLYVAAIAESGAGKDHAPEIIRRAIDDAGLDRYLGGETLASGRAVLSSLESHPAKLFQVDEFGLFLSGVTGPKAASHRAEIWSELMKLFSRAKGTYRGTEYANKKENPRVDIVQPCVCFYGTTTPSTFWRALEGGAMLDGSLARFLVFLSDNDRPERNRRPDIFKASPALIDALQAIARGVGGGNLAGVGVMSATVATEPHTVPMTDDAEEMHDMHLSHEDKWAREVAGTPKAAVVNRLGENAAKLALIRAVSRNPQQPTIIARDVAWGWALAEHCARSLLQDAERFIADTEFEAKLNRALDIIRRHGPVSSAELIRKGFKHPERERSEVLRTLAEAGLIREHAMTPYGPGRGAIRYTATIGQGLVSEIPEEGV